MTVHRTIEVSVSLRHAFAVWTEQVGLWWPPGHSLTGEANARMAFEGAIGGRLVETAPSGKQATWGRILAWEPPHRLAYSFFAGAPAGTASAVEIQFESLGDSTTRILVNHAQGSLSERAWSGSVAGFEAGWAAAIPAYTNHLEEQS